MADGTTELTLFISHSSTDSALAKALIELFEKALKLPARQIRCTSVDGYRLPVGADTEEQLQREIYHARAFLGLITPSSLKSAYVLFELGARWGARKHLAPVLGSGADPIIIAGPLSTTNALRLDVRAQVLQLIEDIAEYLNLPMEPMASYQEDVDNVVAESKKFAVIVANEIERESPVLDEMEINLLQCLSKSRDYKINNIATVLKITEEKALYYVERLKKQKMIDWMPSNQGVKYYLQQVGREVLVKKGLL